MANYSLNVGIFCTGLDTYWNQFDGLRDKLIGYHRQIAERIAAFPGVRVIDAGMVDNPSKAGEAAAFFSRGQVDIVFLYISTYCLSSTILPIAQRVNRPIFLLNLQPTPAIDYATFNAIGDRGKMTGLWLAHCQACSVPEIACVFNGAGIRYDIVTGYLNDQEAWLEIEDWLQAARVACAMRDNRLGILGHYYGGMLDVYTDLTLHSSVFGTHVEMLEMCELKTLREMVTSEEIAEKIGEFHRAFAVSEECSRNELERAAQTSVALDKLIEHHRLGSMAYYYEGSPGGEYENIVTSIIAGNTLLTGRGIPIAGECEVKNVQAMKILSEFGAGGSFSEFYALDFDDGIVMLGHDGPTHFAMAENRVGLVPLPCYHGKPGQGLSIQMKVKNGPVTLLSVVETRQGIRLLVAEGDSVEGPTLQIGNTNSRYRFPISPKEFIDRWSKAGPSHHCAIGVGHIVRKIEKLGFLCNIPVDVICRIEKSENEK